MNSIGAVAETYTPTVTQSVAVTKTVAIARYQQIQKRVFVEVVLNITSSGTGNNALSVSLPITAKNTTGNAGSVGIYDGSATTMYAGWCYLATATTVVFAGDWAGGGTWGTVPNIAIANGDTIWLNLSYEAA
jgi:hypothetical protein